ncbi:MAG: CpsD/CapB family tyrosine-protein kinase, partial [Pyrinomonadaceae bacterium]
GLFLVIWMKFLKSLQKREIELGNDHIAEPDVGIDAGKVTNNRLSSANFKNRDLKIGRPSAAVETLSDLKVEPVRITENGGATNGGSNSSANQKRYADFTIEETSVNQRLVAITQPASAYCEEYRRLRTHLIHKSREKELRSVVIASFDASEGKSITAVNLSWLLAQTDGLKTLLIDGDMHRPSIAEYLGIEAQVGFSDILAGHMGLAKGVIQVNPVGMHIVPAGNSRDDIAELLSGPRLSEILEEAYETFDFVIIDAPPISLFADTSVLLNCSDGALLVVCADRVPGKDIANMVETLPKEKILGVVLNKSDDTVISKRYYEYPYYTTY